MKKKKKKKKAAPKAARPLPRRSPRALRLIWIPVIWAYIGLLWILVKYLLNNEITPLECAAFRFLAVYCLGLGFTLLVLLGFLIRASAGGGQAPRESSGAR